MLPGQRHANVEAGLLALEQEPKPGRRWHDEFVNSLLVADQLAVALLTKSVEFAPRRANGQTCAELVLDHIAGLRKNRRARFPCRCSLAASLGDQLADDFLKRVGGRCKFLAH